MFIKYDANGKTIKAGDCVIRALSKALNQSWEDIYRDLCEIGLKKHRMPNDRVVWGEYLKKKGWIKCSEPRNWDNTRMTVEAAVKYIKNKVLIINAGNLHVTCAIDGDVYDTWNCSKKTMHTYWIRKE